jgi:hypothetical protein
VTRAGDLAGPLRRAGGPVRRGDEIDTLTSLPLRNTAIG